MGDFLGTAKSVSDMVALPYNMVNDQLNRHAQKESNQRNAEENEKNRQFSAEQAELDRNFQAEQAQLAFDRSSKFALESWNRENEYNSPKAQVKRLQDAGINPNVYGGDNTGGSISAVSASVPNGAHGVPPSSLPNHPLSYANPLMERAQTRLMNAQARSLEHDTDRRDDLHDIDIQTAQSNLRLIGLQGDLTSQQRTNLENDAKLALKRIDEIDANISQSNEYKRYLTLQGDALEEENKRLVERIENELKIQEVRYNVEIANAKEVASRMVANLSQAKLNNQLLNESREREVGLSNQNYLDGVKVEVVKDNRKRFINLTYDNEVSALQLSTSENVANKEKSSKEYRLNSMRNQVNWLNVGYDAMEMLSNSLGAGFRIGLKVN